jgi:PleD family two-component response regulator
LSIRGRVALAGHAAVRMRLARVLSMPGRISQSQNLARQVRETVDANIARFGAAPTVMLVTDDVGLCARLGRRLRVRGCEVVEVHDAASFHERVRDGEISADIIIVDDALAGASPFHGLAHARGRGFRAPAIALVRIEDELSRTEAKRLGLQLCGRAVALGSLDRVLLLALRQCLARRVSHAA